MFGIGEGPSSQQNVQYGKLTSAGDFATSAGEKDIDASGNFMRAILSGDSSKISTALAPQIGAAKTAAQQQNKTTAEFGTRGGGTGASTAANNDKIHSDITSLVGQLTGGAASTLASSGAGLLGTGITATQEGFTDATKLQQERAAKTAGLMRDIGKTVAIAAAPFTGGASLLALKAGNGSDTSKDDQSLGGFGGFTKMGG